ncbi:hypothetical protein HN51_012815 [Arachis hypogaea]|nr:uncharacterized protein DS421_3g90290 [Arachis hypogaea]
MILCFTFDRDAGKLLNEPEGCILRCPAPAPSPDASDDTFASLSPPFPLILPTSVVSLIFLSSNDATIYTPKSLPFSTKAFIMLEVGSSSIRIRSHSLRVPLQKKTEQNFKLFGLTFELSIGDTAV